MKRIEWVDIIKGIGSVLVVISHVYSSSETPYMLKTIYLFCMPLYFFVSGYMYKKRDNIKEHIKNKCYQLFVPYFSLLLFFLPISIYIFPAFTNLFYYESVPIDLGRYFFGRSNLNGITGSIWFLPALFFTQVIYNIIRCKIPEKFIDYIILVFLALSYINYLYYPSFILPMYLNLVLASIPIYHIGYLYKENVVKDNIYVMVILLGVTVWGIINVYGNAYNIAANYYGIPFLSLFSSIVLTIFVKNISIGIDKYNILPRFFINLGKASIVIMAFHLTFVILLVYIYSGPYKEIVSNSLFVTIASTAIPFGLYFIFNRFTITRALFMGKKEDARFLKNKLISLVKK